jgi:hypothetical protein
VHLKCLYGNLKGSDHLKDLIIEGRILLEYVLSRYMRDLTGFITPRIRSSGGRMVHEMLSYL